MHDNLYTTRLYYASIVLHGLTATTALITSWNFTKIQISITVIWHTHMYTINLITTNDIQDDKL